MLKRWSVFLWLVMGSACGGSSTTAPSSTPAPAPTTFSLTGQVTDSAATTAIAGATVSIADGPNAGKAATTDTSGNYSFTGLQPSGFTLNVAANGYVPTSRGVTLTSNQTVSFQIARISFQGSWSGTTGQGRPITFVVNSSNAITTLTVVYFIQGSNCTGTTTSSVSFNPPRAITNNSFTIDSSDLTISGAFSSTSAVSGTATFRSSSTPGVPTCAGAVVTTWTAAKS